MRSAKLLSNLDFLKNLSSDSIFFNVKSNYFFKSDLWWIHCKCFVPMITSKSKEKVWNEPSIFKIKLMQHWYEQITWLDKEGVTKVLWTFYSHKYFCNQWMPSKQILTKQQKSFFTNGNYIKRLRFRYSYSMDTVSLKEL